LTNVVKKFVRPHSDVKFLGKLILERGYTVEWEPITQHAVSGYFPPSDIPRSAILHPWRPTGLRDAEDPTLTTTLPRAVRVCGTEEKVKRLLPFITKAFAFSFAVARKKKVMFKVNKTIILPVVLYGHDTSWSLILREEHRLRVLRIFGPKRDEVTGESCIMRSFVTCTPRQE
jgi:hypothetical protein